MTGGGGMSGPMGSGFGGSGGAMTGQSIVGAQGAGTSGASELAMTGRQYPGASSSGSTQGKGGGAELSPNEYGYVALPGGGSASANSAAGSAGNYADGTRYPEGTRPATGAGSGDPRTTSAGGGDSLSDGSTAQLGSASGQGSQMASGMPSMSFDMAQQQSPMQYDPRLDQQQSQSSQRSSSRSTAQVRGKNWALPNMHNASMGVQRPIRVECYSDRLILLPDTHDQEAQTIPLGEHTEDAVDQLVAAVRTYTKSWGMAGRGMYWKPQLMLNVNPNAESRAADLQAILADSGWDVKRR